MSSAMRKLGLCTAIAVLVSFSTMRMATALSVHASHSSSSHTTTHTSTHSGGGYRARGYYHPGHYHNYSGMYAATDGNDSPYYDPGHPVATGAQFSGAAHIDPSQYHYYVQDYLWPTNSGGR